MSTPKLSTTEWRVTCQAVEGQWLSWTVNVYVRAVSPEQPPGEWRMVKTCRYTCPSGQVKNSYWKDLIREAAK